VPACPALARYRISEPLNHCTIDSAGCQSEIRLAGAAHKRQFYPAGCFQADSADFAVFIQCSGRY